MGLSKRGRSPFCHRCVGCARPVWCYAVLHVRQDKWSKTEKVIGKKTLESRIVNELGSQNEKMRDTKENFKKRQGKVPQYKDLKT